MGSLTTIDRGASNAWFDEQLATAARAQRRGSQVALIERTAPSGFMPPLHVRGECETYRLLDGEVTFYVGAEVVRAVAGDVVVAPDGVPRTFRAESGDARWLVLTRVRSLETFLDFDLAVSAPLAEPAAGWPSAEEREAVAVIGAANGIELLGPPGALPESGG